MKKIIKIKPYVLASQKVYTIKNSQKIIKLDWNEFPYSPAKNVKTDLINFLKKNNINWYPNTYPEELINGIGEFVNVDNNNISIFSGSDSGLECISKLLINKKDLVAIFFPNYDQFRVEANILGAKISYINILKHKFNIDKIIKVIKKNIPKLLYISNPNNPLGNFFDEEAISKLIKSFPNTYFIIDEAYIEYSKNYSLSKNINFPLFKNVFILRTFSKCFGLASLRLGYCISNKKNTSLLNNIKNHKSINALAICAGISTFKNINYYQKKIVSIQNSKNNFVNYLIDKKINHIDTHTNFVLIKTDKKKKLLDYLTKNLIFIRDLGHLEGMQKFVRISIGTKSQMNTVINKLNYFYKYN